MGVLCVDRRGWLVAYPVKGTEHKREREVVCSAFFGCHGGQGGGSVGSDIEWYGILWCGVV